MGEYLTLRGNRTEEIVEASRQVESYSSGIGTPDDMKSHLKGFQDAGVDQVIFMQQAGRNKHQHICESLELFASDVMADFTAEVAAREAKKAAALARKTWMKPLAEGEVPVVKASVARAQTSATSRQPAA